MQEHSPLSTVVAGQLLVEFKDRDMFKLVTLNNHETVETALRKLAGFKFLSAPVNVSGSMKIIDLVDIASALVSCDDLKKCFALPIAQVCDLSSAEDNEYKLFDQRTNLLEIANYLSKGNHHRVLVVDMEDDNKPVGIISQMDIARWLAKHAENVPVALRTLDAKNIMAPNPLCVREGDMALSALQKCVKHHYSGVGVVANNGSLVANISLSDLRGLVPETGNRLKLPVMRFLNETHLVVKEPVTVAADTPFTGLVKLLCQNHIHRLYVVDNDRKPTGLISLTSLLEVLFRYTEGSL
jgi:CBS domain-containing protein